MRRHLDADIEGTSRTQARLVDVASSIFLVLACVLLPGGIVMAWWGVMGGGVRRPEDDADHGIAVGRARALSESSPQARRIGRWCLPWGGLLLAIGLVLRATGH